MKNLGLKIAILYIFLAVLNIFFFIIVIFENQIDLITETSKYRTIDYANKIYYQLEDFKLELKSTSKTMNVDSLVTYIRTIAENMLEDYLVFDEAGKIYYQSGPRFPLENEYIPEGQNAIAYSDLAGRPYHFSINEDKRAILFYLPLDFSLPDDHTLILLFSLEMKSINEKLKTLYSLAVLVIVVLAGFHVIFGFFLNRIVIVPIKILAWKSTEISEGNLSARVAVIKKDEIGQLGFSFNKMADSVQATIRKLDEQNSQMRFELVMASAVQHSIYPSLRTTDYFDLAVYHRPYMEVSGDYHSIRKLGPGEYGILIADVAGHGVAAALITMLIKERFEEFAEKHINPGDLLAHINDIFKDLIHDFEKYFTAFYIIIRKNSEAVYSNAAHPKAILIRKGNAEALTAKGMYIGISGNSADAFETAHIGLEPGDRIILYTDGIVESVNTLHQPYGLDRLAGTAAANAALSCEKMLEAVVGDFSGFTGETSHSDDETLMIIAIK